ncbi:transposase, partial [Corynebacterium striatum]
MSRYSEQFRRDAVALYENNEDLSLNAASAELGINRASLHAWVKKYGTEVPRVLFLGICLDRYYFLWRGLLPKIGFHLNRGSVSQALVEP